MRFLSDNAASVCPEIMEAVAKANVATDSAYDGDPWSKRLDDVFSAFFACLCALWYGRSFAFGVGPRPSSPRRTCPPDPTVGPLPDLRIAPLRDELPGMPASRWLSPEAR